MLNSSLYDIVMYGFAVSNKEMVMRNCDVIRDAFISLMVEDEDFIDSIEKATSSYQAVIKRFNKWMTILRELTDFGLAEPRCFSYNLKKQLYEQDKTCQICNNKIYSIDDAALDHIKQFHQGGSTTPENARLTHRYCNWSRPRSEMI